MTVSTAHSPPRIAVRRRRRVERHGRRRGDSVEAPAFDLLSHEGGRGTVLRRAWEARKGLGVRPAVLLAPAEDAARARVCGPQHSRPVRELPVDRVLALLERAAPLQRSGLDAHAGVHPPRGICAAADGSEVALDAYAVTVLWDGQPTDIVAYAADTTPLIGMFMLDHHRLYVESEDGGRVVIEAR